MLPNENRLRRPAEFRAVIAAGRRVRRGCIVVHQSVVAHQVSTPTGTAAAAPIVGFVVGKGVGNSVLRHRVTRRLRAQMHDRLAILPPASATVVRALPGAADVASAQLGRDLDSALARLR